MIAVGREVAEPGRRPRPAAFRYERFATGDLHPMLTQPLSLELTQRAIAPSSSQAYARFTTREEVPR